MLVASQAARSQSCLLAVVKVFGVNIRAGNFIYIYKHFDGLWVFSGNVIFCIIIFKSYTNYSFLYFI